MHLKQNSLIYRMYKKDQIIKIDEKIMMLKSSKMDTATFVTTRILSSFMIFLISLYIFKSGYIIAPFITIIWYYLFYFCYITVPLKRRMHKLDNEALHFFEILTLTLESGRNLENSLEVTCFNVDSEISEEFKKTLFEMKFGKSLIEALEDMKKRIPSETINNIILNITQTNIFGNSIIETMYNQIEFLRDKQILEIKGQINKIPNKISIISVIFIVPLILMLVLGPFILNFLEI